jgi:hypothetical protein
MTRLPTPGQDDGTWGTILNDFLTKSHNLDGTLANNVVGASQLQDASVTVTKLVDSSITASKLAGNIPSTKLDSATQTQLSNVGTVPDGSITTAKIASGGIAESAVTNLTTDLAAKYVKPGAGIPKTDLSAGVQTSLDKADSALQSAPVTSVAGKTGVVTLTPSDVGAPTTLAGDTDVAIATPATGQVLTYDQAASKWKNQVAPSAPVTSVAGKTGAVTLTASDASAVPTTDKGAANGVATLDGTTHVPTAQIPDLSGSYATTSALTTEASTARTNEANASLLTTGTVADARLPMTAQAATLSSTYAAQFTAVAGVTTAAQITAWLAVAYNGKKRLTGSATGLTAPIVIPSNTYLDATGATLTMATGAGCNMLNNTAVTPLRSGSADAVVNGTTTVTSATGAFTSADVGRVLAVGFISGSTHDVGGSTVDANVYANIVTVNSATSVVVDNANNLTESGGVAHVYGRDANIHINGGTWNSCAGFGFLGSSMRFRRVDNLSVTNASVNCFVTGGKYQINPGDCTNVLIENIYSDTASGGSNAVQFTGPASDVVVRGISGTCWDDFIAFCTTDWPNYNDCHGSYSNLRIENIAASGVHDKMVTLYTTNLPYPDGHSFNGVVIDGVKDLTHTSQGVCTAAFINDPLGRIDNLTISNTDCGVSLWHLKHGVVNVNNIAGAIATGSSPGYPLATTNVIENLHITNHVGTLILDDPATVIGNLTCKNGSIPHVNISPAIDSIVFENETFTDGFYAVWGGHTVGLLAFKSCTALNINGTHPNDIDGNSTINNLNVSDCTLTAPLLTAVFVVRVRSGSTVGTMRVSRTTLTGLASILQNSSGTSPVTLFLTDITTIGCDRLVVGATGADIRYTNVKCTTQGHSPFHGEGPMTLRGTGLTSDTYSAFDQAGSGVVHVIDPALQGEIHVLAKANGDTAYNIYGALACGVGTVICDGTNWKNVYSGAVY